MYSILPFKINELESHAKREKNINILNKNITTINQRRDKENSLNTPLDQYPE